LHSRYLTNSHYQIPGLRRDFGDLRDGGEVWGDPSQA
jgi:hypothetical protein